MRSDLKRRLMRVGLLGAAAALLLADLAAASPSYFVYVSDRRVITAEPVAGHELVLNVINLSDDVLVLHPYDILLMAGAAGGAGQVFRNESADAAELFSATEFLQPKSFAGFTVRGDLPEDPERVIFRAASLFFFLQKMDRRDFDVLERQISQIELKDTEPVRALKNAGISQGFGSSEEFPDGETEALSRFFPEVGQPLPPRVLKRVEPKAPDGIPPGSELEVKGLVSKRGELLDARVSRGLSPEADQRALAVIRNSWQFLPAVQDGKVVEATVTLRVKFAE